MATDLGIRVSRAMPRPLGRVSMELVWYTSRYSACIDTKHKSPSTSHSHLPRCPWWSRMGPRDTAIIHEDYPSCLVLALIYSLWARERERETKTGRIFLSWNLQTVFATDRQKLAHKQQRGLAYTIIFVSVSVSVCETAQTRDATGTRMYQA